MYQPRWDRQGSWFAHKGLFPVPLCAVPPPGLGGTDGRGWVGGQMTGPVRSELQFAVDLGLPPSGRGVRDTSPRSRLHTGALWRSLSGHGASLQAQGGDRVRTLQRAVSHVAARGHLALRRYDLHYQQLRNKRDILSPYH